VVTKKKLKALVAKAPAVAPKSNRLFLHTLQIKPAQCAGFFVIYYCNEQNNFTMQMG